MIGSAMLVTTCPECATTFRVTVAVLERAGGQVRCGRCAHIFDANVTLREQPEAETRSIRAASAAAEEDDAPEAQAEAAGSSSSGSRWILKDVDPAAEPDAPEPDAAEPGAPEPGAPHHADDAAPDDDAEAGTPDDDASNPDWLPPLEAPAERRVWPFAAAIALLGLGLSLQLVHRFRAELAGLPVAGPVLIGAYSLLGIELGPRIDLGQYETLDLSAIAQPVTDEQGWLLIETRVQNNGPRVQPFPHIFVRLLDRWGETMAGRYFGPEEYTVAPIGDAERMDVGITVEAQFVIVDPGPGAINFDLEFCVPSSNGFECESDQRRD